MRHSKTLPLDDTRAATVHELRVKDIRQLIGRFSGLSALPITDLLGERFHEAAELLQDCVTLPKDETLDDLTGSELELIAEGFKQVNAGFLRLAGLTELIPAAPSNDSTKPASA